MDGTSIGGFSQSGWEGNIQPTVGSGWQLFQGAGYRLEACHGCHLAELFIPVGFLAGLEKDHTTGYHPGGIILGQPGVFSDDLFFEGLIIAVDPENLQAKSNPVPGVSESA